MSIVEKTKKAIEEKNEIKKYLEWAEKAKKSIACSYGERVRLSGSVVQNPCTCPVCGINPDHLIDLIIAVKAETARGIFKGIRAEGRWHWKDEMQALAKWEQAYFNILYSKKYE